MNWSVVALLSPFALIMSLLSTAGLTRGIEPYLWGVLAVLAALVVARRARRRWFLHGWLVGVAWGSINGLVQATFVSTYLAHNPEAAARFAQSPLNPRLFMFAAGPVIGAAMGLVVGVLALAARDFLVRPAKVQGDGAVHPPAARK